jgi:MFS family permease
MAWVALVSVVASLSRLSVHDLPVERYGFSSTPLAPWRTSSGARKFPNQWATVHRMTLGRNFHKALVASGFANLADGVLWVALPLLAVQLTRSPLLIAGVTVAARIPWLLAPVAGALADRLDRRQSMVRVNLVRTVLLGLALGLASAAYLVGAGFLALIVGSFRAVGASPAGSTRFRDDIAEGARFVWRHLVLRPLAIMLGMGDMAFTAFFSVFVLYAVAPGPMGLSEAGFGILTATIGVGSLLGRMNASYRLVGWGTMPLGSLLGGARAETAEAPAG